MSNIYALADTWNAGGTTFSSILLNVSNGSGGAPVGSAASRIGRYQKNGADVYSFDIAGEHYFTPTADNIFEFDPINIDSQAAKFYFNQNAADVNQPASTRKDVIWTFGYNVNSGGGRVNNAEPTLALHFESYYHQNGTGVEPVLEWHLQSVDTVGTAHRPITVQVPRDGASTTTPPGVVLNADYVGFGDYTGTRKIQFDFGTVPGQTQINYIQQATHIYIANNNPVAKQINVAGNAFLSLPFIDSADRIALVQPVNITPNGPDSSDTSFLRVKAQSTATNGSYLARMDYSNSVTGSVFGVYVAGQATVELSNEIANFGTGDATMYVHSWTNDAKIKFGRNSGGTWAAGLDGSDSDAWVLSAGATLGTTNRIRIDANVVGFPTLPPKITPVAVGSLPSATTVGAGTRHHVTDALAPTFGATVSAGGAVSTPVYSDGTNWKVG
jgi:hypothetical protein